MDNARRTISCVIWVVLFTAALACAQVKMVTVKTAADSEAPGYESHRAMDGDLQTMWHTWFGAGEPVHPHDLVIDLGGVYSIEGFAYVPRSDGNNGVIADFEFYISDNKKDFGRPVMKGRFEKRDGENTIKLASAVSGRYVRLRALSEVNGRAWTSVAELRILSPNAAFRANESSGMIIADPKSELEWEYETLRRDIQNRRRINSHADQTFHAASLICESDRDPADVVLRRTGVLLDDLADMPDAPDLASLRQAWAALGERGLEADYSELEQRFELFKAAVQLRRRIAFSNPLLNFDKMLLLKRHRATFNHMCDQYYGINVLPGGGLFVLSDPFGAEPQLRNITGDSVVQRGRLMGTKLQSGSFLSPDLSWDGRTVAFAYVECEGDTEHRYHTDPSRGHWAAGRSYHIFRVNIDGTDLEQLTDGTWNDFDPCWLPNGRIAFITERRGGYLRCGRVCPTYTLYDMNSDGTDILCLSPHETNEWHPSVTNDGMIVYTRWDYVDRHGCTAHHPWLTSPDGRDARALHGNFAPREVRADMELDVRAIPDSRRMVATGAPHHGQAFGSLVIIDPRVEDDDAMAPVKRLTPEVDFPETQGGAQVYGTPWPLSEKYYLVAYDAGMRPGMGGQGQAYVRGDYGIYLLDVFGNRELIYRDPEISSQNPTPLRATPRPAIVPQQSERAASGAPAEGTLALVNVYDTLTPWSEDIKVTALRVFQIIPMSVPSGEPPHETALREPTAGDSVVLARYVLGTVPVEADGSAHFTVPAQKELFFQALDADGLAVQSMRSATYVQPGERLVCQGCHEPRHRAPGLAKQTPIAMRRPPSIPVPDVDGTNPFSYPRLVQPVLDRHCVSCHQKNADKAPRLDSEVIVKGRQKWYASYFSLAPKFGFWSYGDRHRTIPGNFGARASKLHAMLQEGHHDLQMPPEDVHRIRVWLDSCSLFYGVYEKEGGEAQLRGEIVYPTLE
ncbi:MAG: discoidin domain-containing protein [Phycisphaerae bacterium]|nr:discoidin domain-containing protein [Phycisphaerae bacterium]